MGKITNSAKKWANRGTTPFFLMLSILAGCKATTPVRPVKAVPPAMPVIEQHVEPVVAAVPSKLPHLNFNDPIELTILQAQMRFEKGEELYGQGFLRRAKDEFNSAIDLLLETAFDHPNELRLQKELMELVSRVNAMELAALREGDGFTDQTTKPAAIDDLENVENFHALIDPKHKKTVEDKVREIVHDLPIEINDRVLAFLEYYQKGRGRNSMELG